MRRAVAAAVLALVSLTGCAGGPNAGSSPTTTPSTQSHKGVSLDLTVKGDSITPNGERLAVGTGEPVTLHVRADRSGGFHVHSTPEQQLEFHKGRTTIRFSVDKPGLVDVEEHQSGLVVLQLEVH